MNLLKEHRIQMDLLENYDDRVHQFVKDMTGGEPMTLQDFNSQIETFGNPSERRTGMTRMGDGTSRPSTAWRDFKKDALAYAKSLKLIQRKAPPKRAPYSVQHPKYWDEKVGVSHEEIVALADKMAEFAGNSFPDGDPHDHLYGYFQKKGWDTHDAFDKLVPIAAKKHLGVKTYSDYLAKFWDSIFADRKHDYDNGHKDALDMFGGPNARNPWR